MHSNQRTSWTLSYTSHICNKRSCRTLKRALAGVNVQRKNISHKTTAQGTIICPGQQSTQPVNKHRNWRVSLVNPYQSPNTPYRTLYLELETSLGAMRPLNKSRIKFTCGSHLSGTSRNNQTRHKRFHAHARTH